MKDLYKAILGLNGIVLVTICEDFMSSIRKVVR